MIEAQYKVPLPFRGGARGGGSHYNTHARIRSLCPGSFRSYAAPSSPLKGRGLL
jgi:hypothetical protein